MTDAVRARVAEAVVLDSLRLGRLTTTGLVRVTGLSLFEVLRAVRTLLATGAVAACGLTYEVRDGHDRRDRGAP